MPRPPKAVAAIAHEQGMSEKLARLKAKKPMRASYWVPLTEDSAQELNDAENALRLAEMKGEDTALLQKRLEKAREAARLDSVELLFEAAPRAVYEDLLLSHPQSDKVNARAKEAGVEPPAYSEDFLYSLATVCSVEPVTEQELRDLTADWSWGEMQHLFAVVITVNSSRRALDLDYLGK
jgi:hypothetical protein